MVCYTIHFTGRVQGVGFRYTTIRIARRYRVAGFVQHLSDGRVRLVAEGETDKVEAFVEDVRQQMSHYITGHTVETTRSTGEFASPQSPDAFGVR